MSSNSKEPEVMEWQQEEGDEGGDELSSVQAPSVETTVTPLVRSLAADRTPRSPVGLGFLDKYGKGRRGGGRRTPEPTESLMGVRIRRLDQILGQFNRNLTVSHDR